MTAGEMMTGQPESVTPDQPISRAAELMRDHDVGMIPVVTDQVSRTLVGVITDRDIAIRHVAESHREPCTVGAHMTRDNIVTARDTDDTANVLEAMKSREVRRIPVTNERGALVGVIAQADVAIHPAIPRQDVAAVVTAISEPVHTVR